MSLLDLYHRLPYPARVAAASARGLQLQRWRYGADTESLVAEALRREGWDRHCWTAWQERRLQSLLRSAKATVPWYRRSAAGATDHLSTWPVLTGASLRADPRAFLADGLRPSTLFEDHTSGTTGSPLVVWMSKGAVRRWYALFEARVRRWNGVDRHDRWGIVGGALVVPSARRRPPYWVWNAAGRQLYLSAFHIGESTAAAYADAIRGHRVRYLLGYPSALAALAAAWVAGGTQAPDLAVVVTNAEPLLDHQREAVEAAFGCPVRNTYGMAEAVAGASECEAGTLHAWPDAGVLEVLADEADVPVPDGETGRLVGTSLLNPAMPLIRYRIGDRGALDWEPCPCGRRLPRLVRIEGRMDDMVQTSDGRLVGRLDGIFKATLPVVEAQIVQEEIGRFTVLVVPASGWDGVAADDLIRRLRDRVGRADVAVRTVDAIPRSSNGKFRAVVSRVALPGSEQPEADR